MANILKIKRGTASTIPQGALAEPLFTTDTYDLYIGKGDGTNQRYQKYMADAINGTGVANQLAYFSGANTIAGSTFLTLNLTADNGYLILTGGSTYKNADIWLNRYSNAWENAIRFQTNGTTDWYVGSSASGSNSDFEIYNYGTSANGIKIAKATNNVTVGGTLTATIGALATAATNFVTSDSGTLKSRTAAEVLSDIGAQATSEKGQNNGYASLDSGGKVPVAQLPNSIMEYKGNWDAATNTPTLADGTGNAGDVYLCNVAGTVDLGSGNITFAVGDWCVYNGSIWQKSINSNAVVSVNGQTGVVTITDITGNAGTADKWKTARTLTIGATGKSVDGSANVTWSASDIGLTDYLPLTGGTLTGSLTIEDGGAANNTTAFGSYKRLIFDNAYNNVARGPNKITLYDAGGTSTAIYGLGINNGALSFYSDSYFEWYRPTSRTAFTKTMSLNSDGNLNVLGTITASNFSGSSSGTNTGDQDLSGYVTLTTAQNITGSKTFRSVYGGGTGDFTDITTPILKISPTTGFWRIPFISNDETISGVFNFQTGKNVYWGEVDDTGTYFFRGRSINVQSLSGTSATFSGDVTSSSNFKLKYLTNRWDLYHYTDNTLRFNYNGAGSDEFILTTGGNATFLGTIGASNFSGSSSGTNTGDQDLSGLVTLGTAQTITAVKTFNENVRINTDTNPSNLTGKQLVLRADSANGGQSLIAMQGYDKTTRWVLNVQDAADTYHYSLYSNSVTIGTTPSYQKRFELSQTGVLRLPAYTTNGFVKFSGDDGTLSVDINTYLTTTDAGNTYLPLTGGALSSSATGGILSIRSTSVSGYSAINFLNNSGTQTGSIGWGNATVPDVIGRNALYIYSATEGISFLTDSAGISRKMFLDNSGNLGLGVTPSAWGGGTGGALQIKNGGVYGYSDYEVGLTANAYYNAGWKRIGATTASMIYVSQGIELRTAVSSTADSAISWVTPITIQNTGEVSFTAIPRSWSYNSPSTNYKNIDWGGGGVLYRDDSDSYLTANCYYSTTGWKAKYTHDGGVGIWRMLGGDVAWHTYDGSVTAGSVYTLSDKFFISKAGNVGIGEGVDSFPDGDSLLIKNSGVWNVTLGLQNTGTGGRKWNIFSTNNTFSQGGGKFLIYNATGASDALLIDSSNNSVFGGNVTATSALRLAYSTNNWDLYHYTDNTLRFNYNGAGNDEFTMNTSGNAAFLGKVTIGNSSIQTYGILNIWRPTVGDSSGVIADFTNGTDMNFNIRLSDIGATAKFAEIVTYQTNPLRINASGGGAVSIGTTNTTGLTGNCLYLRASSTNTGQTAIAIQDYNQTNRWAINGQDGASNYSFNIYSAPSGINDFTRRLRIGQDGVFSFNSTDTTYTYNFIGGSMYIPGGQSGNSSAAYTAWNQLVFADQYSDVARGPNKIVTYGRGGGWVGGIGIHNDTQAYYAGGTHKFYKFDGTTATLNLSLDGSGNLTATGGFFESSDMRIKILIEDNYYVQGIDEVKPKLYTKNGKTEIGYYAQDFETILPHALSVGENGYLSLSYREVHTAKIAILEAKIKELELKLK